MQKLLMIISVSFAVICFMRSVAHANEPVPPGIEIFVLDEDVSQLPSGIAYHEVIQRSQLGNTFAPGGSQLEPLRWLLISSELYDDIQSDQWLYDSLWGTVLKEGYGLFVAEKTTGEVSEALDIYIPRSEASSQQPNGVSNFLGAAIRAFPPEYAVNGELTFSSDNATSIQYLENASTGDYELDVAGADFSMVAPAMESLSAFTQSGGGSGPPGFAEQNAVRLGCTGDGMTFNIWDAGQNPRVDDPRKCPWAERLARTCAWMVLETNSPIECVDPGHPAENIPWPPSPLPTPVPERYLWATAHHINVRGTGSSHRPGFEQGQRTGSINHRCEDLEPGQYSSWARIGESFQGVDATLQGTIPNADVKTSTAIDVTLGVQKGAVSGTVEWVYSNGDTWVLEDHSYPDDIAHWEVDYPNGYMGPGEGLKHQHDDCPGSGQGHVGFSCTAGYKTNAAFVNDSAWPGANWETTSPVLKLAREVERAQPEMHISACEFPSQSEPCLEPCVIESRQIRTCVLGLTRKPHIFNLRPHYRGTYPTCGQQQGSFQGSEARGPVLAWNHCAHFTDVEIRDQQSLRVGLREHRRALRR